VNPVDEGSASVENEPVEELRARRPTWCAADGHEDTVTMTTTEQRAGPGAWLGLAVLTLACLLYVMDLTVLHLAVPTLSAQLQPTSAQLLWMVDVYGTWSPGS
jgi:hypothetical protein